jgi:hypothetical protein
MFEHAAAKQLAGVHSLKCCRFFGASRARHYRVLARRLLVQLQQPPRSRA